MDRLLLKQAGAQRMIVGYWPLAGRSARTARLPPTGNAGSCGSAGTVQHCTALYCTVHYIHSSTYCKLSAPRLCPSFYSTVLYCRTPYNLQALCRSQSSLAIPSYSHCASPANPRSLSTLRHLMSLDLPCFASGMDC